MNIIKSKRLRAHIQIARSLLAAVETGASMRIEAGQSIEQTDLNRLSAFWHEQLARAIDELTAARQLTEKGTVQHG